MRTILCLLLYIFHIACCLSARGAVVNFDGGTELATLFNVNGFQSVGGNSQLTQVPSGGILGSGAVDPFAENYPVAATYHAAAFNFALPGSTLSSSIFFRFQDFNLPPNSGADIIQLGFVTDANGTFTFNEHDMSVEVSASSSGIIYLFIATGSGGSGVGNLPLVPGHWYRLSADFLNQSSSVRISASLDDYGTTGAGLAGNIVSYTGTRSASGLLLGDSSVWAGFEASSLGGNDLIDGFVVVPEPGVVALSLAGIIAFGLLGILRRTWGKSGARR